jgi:adenosylmethionine-8-amino-7-oxononanoate aminotransferase
MILAIEVVRDRASGERYDWRERRGLKAYEYALSQGALLRPLGNVIYLMPPYVIEPGQIDWLAMVARGAVDAACA